MNNTPRFKIHIYSPKSGHNDLYSFTKTKAGWKFENYRCKGDVDKSGNPLFYKTLNAESISNPNHLAACISEVWEQAETLDEKQIQHIFDELSRMNL